MNIIENRDLAVSLEYAIAPTHIDSKIKNTDLTSPSVFKLNRVASFLKDFSLTAAGTLTGLTLGSISNLSQTGSILGRIEYDWRSPPVESSGLLESLNDFREHNFKTRGRFPVMFPLFPIAYLAPLFSFSVYNIATQYNSEDGIKKMLD